jgi:hypothetical protein
MSFVGEKKEHDSSSVEKGGAGSTDVNSLHSGRLGHSHPKADDDMHFDERENDGVKRQLNQRHVQMYVYPLSFMYVAHGPLPVPQDRRESIHMQVRQESVPNSISRSLAQLVLASSLVPDLH